MTTYNSWTVFGISSQDVEILNERLLHGEDEIRREVIDFDCDRVGLDPAVRVEFSEPRHLSLPSLLLAPIIGSLSTLLRFFRHLKVLVDDRNEHLQHND